MNGSRGVRWLSPWVPLGLLAGIAGLVGILAFYPGTARVDAAPLSADALAAFQTTDKLVVVVRLPGEDRGEASLRLELLGPDGKVLHQADRAIRPGGPASERFELPSSPLPVGSLAARCTYRGQQVEVPLRKVLLVKAHETSLAASKELYAGSPTALRCSVHGVRSLTETVPLPDAVIDIALKEQGGKVHPLYSGKAGGKADIQLQVPKVPAGSYTLEVHTRSSLGEEKLAQPVKVRTAPRVLLITDKPMYQPGQVIHLRALALEGFDLSPVAEKAITLEVEDSKGNKVFKRALQTSAFGVAAADFQLASEVNQGAYQVRALLGDERAEKTVTVKPYVLPRFKSELKTERRYYLPKETVKAELQVDYFFGKPVAGAAVEVKASTFDVAFKEFQTWKGKTDDNGHVKLEIALPDYFVGQPLQKGDALVRLEAKVTDTADHSETITTTCPVSDQPVKISLIPEGGKLVPEMENRVFAAAIYPDGSPASCQVDLWLGTQKGKEKPLASVKTNAAGLAELRFTPAKEQFRPGEWGQQNVELLGGQVTQVHTQKSVLDLYAEARDAQGHQASTVAALSSEPFGDNVLLRLDRAIYKGGEALAIDVLTSAGLPTVYLDVIRGGQTLLTRWLDVKDGKASHRLDLPASVFGTLEVHAYQMLGSGEIIRDSRVVYVNPASELKIDVKADRDVYLPGAEGAIRFRVTDAHGQPTQAALGVIIVDEAVYALQEMQPGLEKVYFTLQEELLKPQVQVNYKPREGIDDLVREPVLAADKQQIARVLLTAVQPKVPSRWDVEPAVERRRQMEEKVQQIGMALYQLAINGQVLVKDEKSGQQTFAPDALDKVAKMYGWNESFLTDPVGGKLTLDALGKVEKRFEPSQLATAVTQARLQQAFWMFIHYTNQHRQQMFKDGRWDIPADVLDQIRKQAGAGVQLQDAWGHPFRLVASKEKLPNPSGHAQFDHLELVAPGADGKVGTKDDVKLGAPQHWGMVHMWWDEQGKDGRAHAPRFARREMLFQRRGGAQPGMALEGAALPQADAVPLPTAAPGAAVDLKAADTATAGTGGGAGAAAGAPPVRVREYFPETMLWKPLLVTDENGQASLPVTFADSITTWRLTASASSRGGLLGGVSAPLRVFQDFFVEIDLPLTLTQDDEISIPVAVYNYLKSPQTVRLELVQEPWLEVTDGLGYTRSVDLEAGEVTAVKLRIRARKIGHFPLTVKAHGSKMSDAVKRVVEVVPNGKLQEQVVNDRLTGTVRQTLTIPEGAIDDASKLLVKVYPGVFSQVLEGADGILRLPGGCFEQTSSSAYPNILVVDYIKKMRLQSPAVLMKAENYLNVGYQRLLTFERPGGGFDWWGSGEPLVWLSAYGLQEFNDMAQVYPIDRGIIERTQAWLMKQRDADGTWSKIGATHGESIERMGDPKMLLTSYVVWALCDSGLKTPELEKSIAYIRAGIKGEENAYILALAANALASWDAKDDSTHEALTKVLRKLEEKKKDLPEIDACCFPAGGQSLTYARGDSLTVETTALAVLAMLKSGEFTSSVNKSLTYLVKSKGPHGTWGSTQATILALKALVRAAGGAQHKGTATFVVRLNGKEAARGKVTEDNADVLQQFDLSDTMLQKGANEVAIEVDGETSLMYQVVSRHFEPWGQEGQQKPVIDVAVDYDRTRLSTKDLLQAKATLKYNGDTPTFNVILDLGIPPGFNVDPGDFSEMVASKKVARFTITARQVTLYLADVKPGDVHTFEYSLRPRYPLRARTPPTVAYEYYTPTSRGTAKPVELEVSEQK